MKKLLLTLMAMTTLTTVWAQVTPMVLGEKHAMVRTAQDKKYVLLPVQENEEIAAIAVIDGRN